MRDINTFAAFPAHCDRVASDDAERRPLAWELAGEAITVRIRWFGLLVGYVLVNVVPMGSRAPAMLNAILTLGALYAAVDTFWSLRGRVFLKRFPLAISLLEAVFIGLLCYYDRGPESPFRFYYVLSLVCTALRHEAWITYTTWLLHSASFVALATVLPEPHAADPAESVLTVVVLGWVTWASTALGGLLKRAGLDLTRLNRALQEHQAELEDRIAERTRELQEAQAHMLHQEKMAAFGLLAAGIAHEVGNPLASISSLVQLLARRHKDPHTQARFAMIAEQLRRIQRTLRELVDFSRPTTKLHRLANLNDAVAAALSIAKYYKRTEGKQIVTDFDRRLPVFRLAHDQWVQVFLNLVLNAIDATPKGGRITIRTRLQGQGSGFRGSGYRSIEPYPEPRILNPEPCVQVEIADTGHGIPPGDSDRVFQPYYTTKENGTGLGLFVSRKLVEEMGGRLELVETGRSGTTFRIEIPLPNSVPLPAAADVQAPAEPFGAVRVAAKLTQA